MAYIVQADLVPARIPQKEIVELTADQGTEVDTAVLDEILNRASGTIDSYAGGHYDLPLAVSQQVKDLALDLAEFYLFDRRRRVPDSTQKKYDAAIRFLQRVQDGKGSLEQPGKTQTVASEVVTKDHTDPEQQDVFDDEKLRDY